MSEALWGIDLGGTKIEGIILPSLNLTEPVCRIRIDTEANRGYSHILAQINKLLSKMVAQCGMQPRTIGFGTPGTLDPVLKTMKNCNTVALNGKPLKSDLEEMLKIRAVIANDANCFALAETHWGVVKHNFPSAGVVFGIIMGTGVGGGIVINGKVWNGHHGIAGEWGHNFLDESGGPCYCGKSGCVETIISGPALEKYYYQRSGHKLKLDEIALQHTNGANQIATETIQRLGHFFGKAVSAVVNVLDPDVIVVGGGLGNLDALYTEGANSLRQFIFNNTVDVRIVKPALGDSGGVFGAAALSLAVT